MKLLINRVRAYIRLCNKKDNERRIRDFSNEIYKAIRKKDFTDKEKANILEIVNFKMNEYLRVKKTNSMAEYLDTEKAYDITRILNIKL